MITASNFQPPFFQLPNFKLLYQFSTSINFNNMLSSADLNLERALFIAVLTLFFGAGFLSTLLIFIMNAVRKKNKSTLYYFLWFLISGITAVILAGAYFYMLFIKEG